MSFLQTPAYNLKVVLKETGIAADTLRAWERRYGLPMPERTSGGHRLYSQYDIALIKWLIAKQDEGLSISRAVEFFREQTTQGLDPLSEIGALTSQAIPTLIVDTGLAALRQQWLGACMSFNETSAEQVLNQAFAMHPVELVCVDVLQKGLVEIGEQWYQNGASVQQEHFASALAMRRLDALISACPAPTRSQSVMIACPPDEWHTFTPLLLTLLLRRRGLNVIYLGANVPMHQMEDALNTISPDLIILVAQQLHIISALNDAVRSLIKMNARIAFGGRIFNAMPSLREKIPGFFLGHDLGAALENTDMILRSKPAMPNVPDVSAEYAELRQAFSSKRMLIEMEAMKNVALFNVPLEEMGTANTFMFKNILSALAVGDLDLLKPELEWLKTLLKINNMNGPRLAGYIQAYADAIDTVFGETGGLLRDWLKAYLAEYQAAHAH
jgi:DNA-binding transcriptional MerR regulator